jgi:PAS domain-containing protein
MNRERKHRLLLCNILLSLLLIILLPVAAYGGQGNDATRISVSTDFLNALSGQERAWQLLAVFTVILLALVVWNRKLAGEIRHRKEAEEKLQALSSRQDAILAAIPDIIMEVDAGKVYRWASRAGLEFFGEDVIGKEAQYYFEGEQNTYDQAQPIFIGNENIIYIESWQRRKDGQKRLLAW